MIEERRQPLNEPIEAVLSLDRRTPQPDDREAQVREAAARSQAQIQELIRRELHRIFEETGRSQTSAAAPSSVHGFELIARHFPEDLTSGIEEAAPTAAPVPPVGQALDPQVAPAKEADAFTPVFDAPTIADEDGDDADLDGEVYEGSVRLEIESHGPMRAMPRFISELWQHPRLRLLRVDGRRSFRSASIRLELREALPLAALLTRMESVRQVEDDDSQTGDGNMAVLKVVLDASPADPSEAEPAA